MAEKALAALGVGVIAAGVAVTTAFGTGQQAHAANTLTLSQSKPITPPR